MFWCLLENSTCLSIYQFKFKKFQHPAVSKKWSKKLNWHAHALKLLTSLSLSISTKVPCKLLCKSSGLSPGFFSGLLGLVLFGRGSPTPPGWPCNARVLWCSRNLCMVRSFGNAATPPAGTGLSSRHSGHMMELYWTSPWRQASHNVCLQGNCLGAVLNCS